MKGIPLRLRFLGMLVILRHPWRALRAFLSLHGWIRTRDTYYCPGCGYRSRRWPAVRRHECENLSRKGRRRIEAAARKKGTVKV